MTDVEILNSLGGKLGSKLIGDEGFGPEIIVITAIGEENVLARRLTDTNGNLVNVPESFWTLHYRDWKLLEEVCDSGLNVPTTLTTT